MIVPTTSCINTFWITNVVMSCLNTLISSVASYTPTICCPGTIRILKTNTRSTWFHLFTSMEWNGCYVWTGYNNQFPHSFFVFVYFETCNGGFVLEYLYILNKDRLYMGPLALVYRFKNSTIIWKIKTRTLFDLYLKFILSNTFNLFWKKMGYNFFLFSVIHLIYKMYFEKNGL